MNDKPLNKPFVSSAKDKKYAVYVKKDEKVKLIHFGHKQYQHYKDKLGHYANLDHNDKKRRENFLKRAKGIKDKDGKYVWDNPASPTYWSIKILW